MTDTRAVPFPPPPPPPPQPAPGSSPRVWRRRTLAALFLLYMGVLALVVFWPSPVDQDSAGTLKAVLRRLHGMGMPGWVNYSFVEHLANVVMFVPFGLLGAAWLPERRIWMAAAGGVVASCLIESAQAVLLPNRFATIYDVTANSLGAALGCIVVYAWHSRRTPPSQLPPAG